MFSFINKRLLLEDSITVVFVGDDTSLRFSLRQTILRLFLCAFQICNQTLSYCRGGHLEYYQFRGGALSKKGNVMIKFSKKFLGISWFDRIRVVISN